MASEATAQVTAALAALGLPEPPDAAEGAQEEQEQEIAVAQLLRDNSAPPPAAPGLPELPADASEAARNALQGARVAAGRAQPDDTCPICMCDFAEGGGDAVELARCQGQHFFHHECAVQALAHSARCAVCGVWYAANVGDMPEGTMTVAEYPPGSGMELEGLPGVGVLEVSYSFPGGTQGPEHPSPGQRYKGTSRQGYLPDTDEGRLVLRLLRRAFEQRLTFTIGTSVTTGQSNRVIWNGIHHKTSTCGGPSAFGYPDETFLSRVREELAAKGIVVGGEEAEEAGEAGGGGGGEAGGL